MAASDGDNSQLSAPRRHNAVRRERAHDWEAEYWSRKWAYFTDLAQAPRYVILVEWCRRLCGGGSILDVACSEAVLLDHLRQNDYAQYRGFDFIASAVERAQKRIVDPSRAVITCNTMEDYDPASAAFDAVVFNECLYYAADAVPLVGSFLSASRPGGVALVSIGFLHAELASAIENAFRPQLIESLTVGDRLRDKGWQLLAIRKA